MSRRSPFFCGAGILVLLAHAGSALEIGAVVPDFGMPTIDGRSFSLAHAQKTHTAVVILFISTICPYSNYYNDLVRDLSAQFSKKGVAFVGVNSGTLETAEEARAHALRHGHAFDVIKDPESRLANLLDARRTPEVFLLDPSGNAALPRPHRLEDHRTRSAKCARRPARRPADPPRRDQGLRLRDPAPVEATRASARMDPARREWTSSAPRNQSHEPLAPPRGLWLSLCSGCRFLMETRVAPPEPPA